MAEDLGEEDVIGLVRGFEAGAGSLTLSVFWPWAFYTWVFVTDVDLQGRVPEHLEAVIMNCLYAAPAPFCYLSDKGMMLAPKWDSEKPISVWNACESKLHGLPERLSI